VWAPLALRVIPGVFWHGFAVASIACNDAVDPLVGNAVAQKTVLHGATNPRRNRA
jgi:hypothetical protein